MSSTGPMIPDTVIWDGKGEPGPEVPTPGMVMGVELEKTVAPALAEASRERLSVKDAAARADPRKDVTDAIRTRSVTPESLPALRLLIADIARQVNEYGALDRVPAEKTTNVRNDMYLASEMLSRIAKNGTPQFDASEQADLKTYKAAVDNATKFIPTWVKVAVAIALGMGTMVGWKRIVVTVGEKIGKTHLTYAQGASAEIVAMATIGAADVWGWPVSTTHVLSSGVAGTMAANRSGLQRSTIMSMVMAWVLTLPAAIMLSGVQFWIFRHTF